MKFVGNINKGWRQFDSHDWDGFAGAENFSDGSPPVVMVKVDPFPGVYEMICCVDGNGAEVYTYANEDADGEKIYTFHTEGVDEDLFRLLAFAIEYINSEQDLFEAGFSEF